MALETIIRKPTTPDQLSSSEKRRKSRDISWVGSIKSVKEIEQSRCGGWDALLFGGWEINKAMIETERAHGVLFIQHTSIGHLPCPKHGMKCWEYNYELNAVPALWKVLYLISVCWCQLMGGRASDAWTSTTGASSLWCWGLIIWTKLKSCFLKNPSGSHLQVRRGLLFRWQEGEVRVKEGQQGLGEGREGWVWLFWGRTCPPTLFLTVFILSLDSAPALAGPSLLWPTSLHLHFSASWHWSRSFVKICLYVCFSSWTVSSLRHRPSFILFIFCRVCLFLA